MFKYEDFIKELDFNLIPTIFTTNKVDFNGKEIDEYTFTTIIKRNDYSVYFMLTEEDDEILPNKKHLSDYIDIKNIPTIFFSLSEKQFDETFDELTNKQEFLEVMGKVAYIIRQYMDTYNYDVYSYNCDEKRNNFYNYYRKHFNDFLRIELFSKNYFVNGNKKKIQYLIKDYQRYLTESKCVKFSDGSYLKLPWSK